MQNITTEIVVHLSQSYQQLARILDAKRHIAMRMAELVHTLPDVHPQLGELDGLLDHSAQVTKSVIGYLNSLADLEDTVAESLTSVMQAVKASSDEE